MKETVKLLKVFTLSIYFEVTIIGTEVFNKESDVKILLYLAFGVISFVCFVHKMRYFQFLAGLLTLMSEAVILIFQQNIFNMINTLLNVDLNKQNCIDNYLICIVIQLVTFFVSIIMVREKK